MSAPWQHWPWHLAVAWPSPPLAISMLSCCAAAVPLILKVLDWRRDRRAEGLKEAAQRSGEKIAEKQAAGTLDDLLLDNAKDAVAMANERADRAEQRADRLEERVNRLDRMLTEAQATIRTLEDTIRDHEATIRELQRDRVRQTTESTRQTAEGKRQTEEGVRQTVEGQRLDKRRSDMDDEENGA